MGTHLDLDTQSRDGGVSVSRRAVLLAGLAAAGCGQAERPTIKVIRHQSSTDPQTQALREILDRRVKALRNDDERTFLADIDDRNRRLISEQKMVFANLRQLEFTRFDYVLDRASHAEEGRLLRFDPVIQITQLVTDVQTDGFAPAETFQYTLVARHDKLAIVEIKGLDVHTAEELGVNGPMADAPWNYTPLHIIRAGKVWIAGDGSVTDLEQYADAARTHLRDIEAIWGDRLTFPGHILFLTKNTQNFKNWYSIGAYDNFDPRVEGAQIPLQGVRKSGEAYSGQYAGARIVVNLQGSGPWSDPELVMRHELAHAVTARATSVEAGFGGLVTAAPRWAIEGFARWVETVGSPSRMADLRLVVRVAVLEGRFSGKPPESDAFYGENVAFNYDLGASVFAYVDKVKGQNAAVEFYASVIEQGEIGGASLVDTPIFDGICRRVVGVRGRAFLQRWAAFVRGGAI
ncbi:hypothetical protein ABN034_21625 [Actinopolymorpha sp. B11F2]|uniref:hypothetical protein n=1 Tax=Actinopolymorpha sp. B11F2 TaxID=3160862 RepID=UPI0032E4A6C7